MRLSKKEVIALNEAFRSCLSGITFILYLFGSRVDDKKKGGDIDLLCVVEPGHKQEVVNLKSKIRSEVFKRIPEQKIDITVATPEECRENEFLLSVESDRIELLRG